MTARLEIDPRLNGRLGKSAADVTLQTGVFSQKPGHYNGAQVSRVLLIGSRVLIQMLIIRPVQDERDSTSPIFDTCQFTCQM